ncbi:MAG: dUTP diphosphatase, partial [Candidatus Gracilibacteria bacterium]|nr:dUTP diphosphatase [Candidatus Gracilibacteria bacterium]
GVGIIDLDYCGPTDEVKTLVYNFTDADVTIERGTKISQGIFVRVDIADWEEVEEVHPESRGGFGSTG